MNRRSLQPTRLTLLFYAAFAASFVQDRYTSPNFYRWVVGAFIETALVVLIPSAFLILVFGAVISSLRARRFAWAHAAAAFGALVAAELIWRYGVNSLPGMGFKDVAYRSRYGQAYCPGAWVGSNSLRVESRGACNFIVRQGGGRLNLRFPPFSYMHPMAKAVRCVISGAS